MICLIALQHEEKGEHGHAVNTGLSGFGYQAPHYARTNSEALAEARAKAGATEPRFNTADEMSEALDINDSN